MKRLLDRTILITGASRGIGRAIALAAAREGELQRSSLDVSLAREELGFSATTDLKTGVAATVEVLRG